MRNHSGGRTTSVPGRQCLVDCPADDVHGHNHHEEAPGGRALVHGTLRLGFRAKVLTRHSEHEQGGHSPWNPQANTERPLVLPRSEESSLGWSREEFRDADGPAAPRARNDVAGHGVFYIRGSRIAS